MLLPWMGGSTPGQDPTSDFFTLVCTRGEQGRISACCVHGERASVSPGVHGRGVSMVRVHPQTFRAPQAGHNPGARGVQA